MDRFRTNTAARRLRLLLVVFGIAAALRANSASAAVVSGVALPGLFAPAAARVTLDDTAAGPGNLSVTVEVIASPNIGDLRAVYFHVSDETLLGPGNPFSVVGSDITDSAYSVNKVRSLSLGTHINPVGDFDMGFEIGSAGIVDDDIRTTTFVLSHDQVALTVDHFRFETFAVRLTHVGLEGSRRSHLTRSKLIGTFSETVVTVPEPATMTTTLSLLALGGGRALSLRRRDRRGNRKPMAA